MINSTDFFSVMDRPPNQSTVSSIQPTRFDFTVDHGMLVYNHGKHLLLSKQVLPFSNVMSGSYHTDMTFIRTSVRMTQKPDGCDFNGGTLMLSPESYSLLVHPDCAFGFFGSRKNYNSSPPRPELEMLENLCGGWRCFNASQWPDYRKLIPVFYVPISDEQLAKHTKAHLINLCGCVEMFDIETKSWRIFKRLPVGPVVVPNERAPWFDDRARSLVCFALTERLMFHRIYIGHDGAGDEALVDRKVFTQPFAMKDIYGAAAIGIKSHFTMTTEDSEKVLDQQLWKDVRQASVTR